MKFETDAPLTISILGALHMLKVATIPEIAGHLGQDDRQGRDKIGTTVRRMERAGLVAIGACVVTDRKRVADMYALSINGETKRLELIRLLIGFGVQTTERRGEVASHLAHNQEIGGSNPPAATNGKEERPRVNEGAPQPVSTTG